MVAAVIVGSCSKSGGYSSGNNNTPPPGTANAVSIVNMSFSPANLTVSPGTTVTWTNNDAMTHTVTADDNSFNSGNMATGSKFSKAFAAAGTYPYHCSIHAGMTGTITVKAY
ncbi:MAG TPA: plastocyanin [Chitinophagaceae bacterium]|nr:plastocyanin [Chitinophagaceae bacterium]